MTIVDHWLHIRLVRFYVKFLAALEGGLTLKGCHQEQGSFVSLHEDLVNL